MRKYLRGRPVLRREPQPLLLLPLAQIHLGNLVAGDHGANAERLARHEVDVVAVVADDPRQGAATDFRQLRSREHARVLEVESVTVS